jgi:phosphate transport system protein
MPRHFHEELGELKQKLITMSRLAEYTIQNAIEGLDKRNTRFAELVFEKEKTVNLMEIEIDDKGHSLLALAQPMAADLRMVTTILKINTALERIADHAVNIAERVILLLQEPEFEIQVPIPPMAATVQNILKDAVESFIQEDVALAQSVLRRDDEVDRNETRPHWARPGTDRRSCQQYCRRRCLYETRQRSPPPHFLIDLRALSFHQLSL